MEPMVNHDAKGAVRVSFLRHGSGVRRCAKQKSKGLRRLSSEARCTFGAPSAWIFLGRLHSCRAGLRFSRREQPSQFTLAVNVKARTIGSTWTEAIAKG